VVISLRKIFTPISVAINLATGNFVAASADLATDKIMPKKQSVNEANNNNKHLFLPKFKNEDRKSAQSLVGIMPTKHENGLGRVYGVNAFYSEMEAKNNRLAADKYKENFTNNPIVAISAAKVKPIHRQKNTSYASKILRESKPSNNKKWVRDLSLEKPVKKLSFVQSSRSNSEKELLNKLAVSQKLSFQAMVADRYSKEQRYRSAA